MIVNIVDFRLNSYSFLKINAVVEAAWHDNSIDGADQIVRMMNRAPAPSNDGPEHEEREHISLEEAVVWAGSFPQPVTLYIYDPDSGIYPNNG
jgi:hypothetical protein